MIDTQEISLQLLYPLPEYINTYIWGDIRLFKYEACGKGIE
jgi:hypothetical protein